MLITSCQSGKLRVLSDQVKWEEMVGWAYPAQPPPAGKQGRPGPASNSPIPGHFFSGSSLLFYYDLCTTSFLSFSSAFTSLNAWDLVDFLKEKVDRVVILSFV